MTFNLTVGDIHSNTPNPIIIYGDESTASNCVTYGLVAFNGELHLSNALSLWNKIIEEAGAPANSRVHAREIFSGDARKKTHWKHLSESQSSDLVGALMNGLSSLGAMFFLGLVHKDSFPDQIPAGLNKAGQETFVKLKNEHCYAFGFIAAAAGLMSENGVLKDGMAYSLFVDPQDAKVHLWGIGNMQIRRLIEATGLTPTTFQQKPLLIDAADLFAYAAARSLATEAFRNKEACTQVVRSCNPNITHYWWQAPDDSISQTMREKLGI